MSLPLKVLGISSSHKPHHEKELFWAEDIMNTRKYIALVLSNLALFVLCEPEEPLDRGMSLFVGRENHLNLNIESSLKFSVLQSVSNFVGWGEKIEWKTLQDGLEEAKKR